MDRNKYRDLISYWNKIVDMDMKGKHDIFIASNLLPDLGIFSSFLAVNMLTHLIQKLGSTVNNAA